MTHTSHSLEQTRTIAKEILNLKPKVIALKGDLGSGKTALVKMIALELGIKEDITSPTFVLAKFYDLNADLNKNDYKKLVHIDAYRVENESELANLKFDEWLSGNLVCIEWPEKIKGILPECLFVGCEFVNETTRSYTF